MKWLAFLQKSVILLVHICFFVYAPSTRLFLILNGALNMANWVKTELSDISTGDTRIDSRAIHTVSIFADNFEDSIPEASPTHKELTGAYRMLDNDRLEPRHILEPHMKSTIARAEEYASVTIAHDTTEIVVNHSVEGMGKTTTKKCGCYAHASMAFSPNGTPLGLINTKIWTRDSSRTTRKKLGKEECAKIPFEKRESFKWIQGVMSVAPLAEAYPDKEWINVCDSESDMYSFYEYCEELGLPNFHYVIRACQDMRMTLLTQDSSEKPVSLRQQIERHSTGKPADCYRLPIREREAAVFPRNRHHAQTQRMATVEVRRFSVYLCSPVKSRKNTSVRVNVVHIKEKGSSKIKNPIEWILLTSLPVATRKQLRRVREAYEQRWQIELYFRTLKSGCNVEKRRLRTYSRFAKCLSIYMIIAWRINYITYIARSNPNASCETVFHKKEWQAVEAYFNNGKVGRTKPPKLTELILKIARLGGYKQRKTPPGIETIWRGLNTMGNIVSCWILFK